MHRSLRRLAASLALGATALRAQIVAPSDTSSTSSPDTLTAIHISVLRTPFDLGDAPFAVSVVTQRDGSLARTGRSLADVLGSLSGVQADDRLNFALGDRISIRGVGARAQFGVRGIRVIVDDIPATLADGQSTLNNVDLASFGTAEVLRGPASALYGNAAGGVIVLRSAPPSTASIAPRIQVLTGSDGLRRAQLGASGSRGHWGYLLTGDQLNYAGYRDWSRAKNTHGNGVVSYETERASIHVVVNTEHHDAQNPGGLSDSLLATNRRRAFANNVAQRTGERGSQLQTGTSARFVLPAGEVQMSGYLLQRSLDNPIPPTIITLDRHAGGGRVAYALTRGTNDRAVTGMIGAESDMQHDDRANNTNVKGALGALTLDQRERVSSLGPFAQLSGVLGAAHLFGSVRYDRVHFAVADRLVTSTNPDDSGDRTLSAVSPSFGASYAAASALTLYANATTSFQTPTTTELANRPTGAGGFNSSLQPEHTHSIELGGHGVIGSRFSYQLDVYRMRITDELLPFEVATAPGRTYYRNTGEAEHRGMEIETRATLTSHLTARATYTSIRAVVLSDTASNGATVGKRVPGVAPYIATAALDAGRSDGPFASLEARAEGRIFVNDVNTVTSPASVVANLRGALPIGHTGMSVIGGMSNLFDRQYNTSVVINAAGGRYFEPAAGRTVYIGCSWIR